MKCDILVVGAGASGSTASLVLSRAGFDVITVDRADRIGGFTNNKIDITESELPDGSKLDPILKDLKIKPIERFNSSIWNSRNERFKLKSDVYDLYFKRGPEKDSLDFQLMKKAIGKGCVFLPKTDLLKFNFNNGRINEVIIRNKGKKISLKPETIVGADGSFSMCRKLAKIGEESYCLEGFGTVFKGKVFKDTHIILDSEFAPGGYLYAGSTSNESFVGIITDSQIAARSSKQFFSINESHNDFFKVFEKFKPLNFFGGRGKYGTVENIVKLNLTLVGGAGLLVDPFLGYGLDYAIFSGYKAAKAIIGNKMTDYGNLYKERFSNYLKDAMNARDVFKKLDNKEIDSLVRSLRFIQERKIKEMNFRSLFSFLRYNRHLSINTIKMLFLISKIGL